MNCKVKYLWLAFVLAFATKAAADEGMWMLNKIDPKTAEAMQSLGCKLSPLDLYNPNGESLKDAVVDFGDFCSGVVVSPNGLVFTNHHCGYGAIQSLSTPEDDILKNGFVAQSYEEERPVPGLFVRFLLRTEECSSRVMMALDSIYRANPTVPAREIDRDKLDSICNAVEKEYQLAHPDLDCQLKSYYGGNAYYISFYKVYEDVRLVFTATESLGKFGGDTDNWMWPRQTCDFSVFRIYAGRDGEPAPYSKENVPLRPKRYAKVSLDGYEAGDFCMTVGYPGSTSRYLSSWGIRERVEDRNISVIQVRGKKQDVWKRWMQADRNIALKYASKWAGSSNYWKNSIGMNKAIANLGVIGLKQQTEQQIKSWYEGREDLKRRFENVFPQLEKAYAERREAVHASGFFNETFVRGIEIARVAQKLNRLPQDANSSQIAATRQSLEKFFKDYEPRVDEETMAVLLQNYREQVTSAKYQPACYQTIDSLFGGDCRAYAADLFKRTICKDISCLDALLADSTLRDSDPALLYEQGIPDMSLQIGGSMREQNNVIGQGERLLTQALLEMDQEMPHYSDANFSMRLSYGFIQDYTAGGTHFDFYTAAPSLLAKAERQNEVEDYRLEADIVELMKRGQWGRYADKRTGQMHLCFISNNDITGGNSGSPMFNGRGELIGLAFDGNWEAMSGDISFDNSLQRCIGVDIRFVLFLIEHWGKSDRLIREILNQR